MAHYNDSCKTGPFGAEGVQCGAASGPLRAANGFVCYVQDADGATYRLATASDYAAPAEQVRAMRARRDWNVRSALYVPADGLIALDELPGILARTSDGAPFTFVGLHLTHHAAHGEPRYLVVVADGLYTIEMATYQQFIRLAGYSQPAAAAH